MGKGRINDDVTSALEEAGFKRWQKNTMDRLYINAKQLGLELQYYNTGNIRDAVLNGDQLSNSDGRRLLMAKTYIDVNTGEIKSTDERLAKATQDFVKTIKVKKRNK